MTEQGHVVENPVTGEKAIFPEGSRQAGDDLVRFDLFVRPGGFVTDEHIHPYQEESFLVKAGTIRLRVGDEERDCTTGDEAVVPAGTTHSWWNAGEDEVHAVVELRGKSAGRFVPLITSLFALAQAGKTDEKGNPGLLQVAVILYEYRDVMWAAPVFVQKVIVPPVALLGRLVGYRPDYPYPSAPSATYAG